MGSIKTHMLLPRAHKIFGYPTQTPSEQPRNTIYRQSENICPYVKTGCAPLKQPQLVQKGTTPVRTYIYIYIYKYLIIWHRGDLQFLREKAERTQRGNGEHKV